MKYNYAIVGAGLSGSVLASVLANDSSKSVLVIDKREHIAGNCYDFAAKNGVFIHKYGPHIFHTNSEQVWRFLSEYTDWLPYQHRVLARIHDKYVPVPFNLDSISKCFSSDIAIQIETKLIEKYGMEAKIPILKLRQEGDKQLKMLADFIYQNVFLYYTTKQWDMKPEELDISVTSRIPVFVSRDDRYFQDKYQGVPKLGYTKLIENILNKPNITVVLNTEYHAIKDKCRYDVLFWTGMIDEYYGYKFDKLPYRSLRFEFEDIKGKLPYQPTAQVNYTMNEKYTRITEFAHFQNMEQGDRFKELTFSTITREYSFQYNHATNETPYYPIPQPANTDLYLRYRALATESNVVFLGRLADYNYYNMDQAILKALQVGEQFQK